MRKGNDLSRKQLMDELDLCEEVCSHYPAIHLEICRLYDLKQVPRELYDMSLSFLNEIESC